MLGHIKSRVFSLIAGNRDSLAVKGLHKVATFVDSAYRNEGSDFFVNGEQRVLNQLAKQNPRLVIDVGANVGYWTIAALEAWPECGVHCFEIAPETLKKCQVALARHPQGRRATAHGVGMSNEAGSIQMYYYPDMDEMTCASPGRHDPSFDRVPFVGQVTTLDDFCRDAGISQIDFLKIDVEGTEHKVLQGADRLLSQGAVSCIQFEYGAFSVETRFMLQDYYDLLGKNYWIGKIYPHYVDFQEYDWTLEDYRFCNYVCALKSKPELRKLLGR